MNHALNRDEPPEANDDPRITRRTYLRLATVGAASAGVVGSSSEAASAASDGFGAGGFGDGTYGGTSSDGGLVISTVTATVDGETSATLTGEVSDLGGAESVDASFEYRPNGDSSWSTTSATTRTSPGTFEKTVTGLAAGRVYEFRAVGEASDGDAAAGDVRTFSTPGEVSVTTGTATDVDGTSATLSGELTDLGGASSAVVAIEWGRSGEALDRKTDGETVSTTGSFAHSVTGLDRGTEYAYRAIAETSDGSTAVGATRTVTTDAGSNPPTIDRVSATEAGRPNPHASISVDWRVSDEDGDLRRVKIEIRAPDGRVVDETESVVDGSAGADTDSFKMKHGGGTDYEAILLVTDGAGNEVVRSETVRS